MSINKTIFIAQLPQALQHEIEIDVKTALSDTELTAEEKETALKDAMDSRLCDLSDLIEIGKYIV